MLQPIKITGRRLVQMLNNEWIYPNDGSSSTRKWYTKVVRKKLRKLIPEEIYSE